MLQFSAWSLTMGLTTRIGAGGRGVPPLTHQRLGQNIVGIPNFSFLGFLEVVQKIVMVGGGWVRVAV